MECPSGISPSAAVITGWIYGSERDPADKYVKGMQKMVDDKSATKVGTQQVGILELMHACDNFVCILPYVKGTSDKIADICRKQLTHTCRGCTNIILKNEYRMKYIYIKYNISEVEL